MKRLVTYLVSGLVALVLTTFGFLQTRSQTAAMGMEVAGQFGGASYAVTLRQAQDGVEQPPYLILGVGPRLVVMDATNPEQPVKVGQSEILPGVVRALALSGSLTLSGSLVFAATGLGGLQVIDLAEPTQPAVIASYDTGGYLEDLAVAGSVVYLASTPKWDGSNWVGASLQVVDVSDPRQLRLLGGYDTPGYEHGVAAAGGWVFVADGDGGLRVLEGANPAALREVGAYDTPGYALDVATDGEYAYVADFTEGVRVVDVGDPANPKEVEYVETPGKARGLTLAGQTVYVADGEGGMRVVDVTQPEQAREVGALQAEGDVRGVAALGTTTADSVIYVADRKSGLRVVEVKEGGALREVGGYETTGFVDGVAVGEGMDGEAFVLVAGSGHLLTLRLSRSGEAVILGSYETSGQVEDVVVLSPSSEDQPYYAVVAEAPHWRGDGWSETGLRVYEVSVAGRLSEVGFAPMPGEVHKLDSDGDTVFVAAGSGGVRRIDFTNPLAPQETGYYELGEAVIDVAAAEAGCVYLTTGSQVIDLCPGEETAPPESGSGVLLPTPDTSGEHLSEQQGLRPLTRRRVAMAALMFSDDFLYFGDTPVEDALLEGERSQVSRLRLIGSEQTSREDAIGLAVAPGQVRGITLLGDEIYLAGGDGGVVILQRADGDK
ncbi:MAG: hypothetical protein K1X65_20235 [Caldilineales bacterium]|nr:hypothetical protein [Caldilineales bacterium]